MTDDLRRSACCKHIKPTIVDKRATPAVPFASYYHGLWLPSSLGASLWPGPLRVASRARPTIELVGLR